MSSQMPQKIINSELEDFMEKYHGRRIEVTCTDGSVFTGKVDWDDEGDEFGISFDDVRIMNGPTISGWDVPLSLIKSFVPLENQNAESIFA